VEEDEGRTTIIKCRDDGASFRPVSGARPSLSTMRCVLWLFGVVCWCKCGVGTRKAV
jgi:hypothetical protein